MTETIFILWIYYSGSWAWLSIPMSPGWVSTGPYSTRMVCETKAMQTHREARCLPPTDRLEPIAWFDDKEVNYESLFRMDQKSEEVLLEIESSYGP